MRLSSANAYDNSLDTLTARQSALAAVQEQLTSGKKVSRPSDDPVGASQAERALTRIERVKVEQRALGTQRDTLGQIESTLGNASASLQRFRELVVQAGNGSLTGTDRSTIVQEMRGLRDQLLSMANSTDVNGQPLFSGLGSNGSPFIESSTNVTFKGINGQSPATGVSVPLAMDGNAAFGDIPKDNGTFNITKTALGQISTDLGQATVPSLAFTTATTNFSAAATATFKVDGTLVTLNANYGSATAVAAAIQTQLPSGYMVTASGNNFAITNTLSAANAITAADAGAVAAGIANVPGNVDYTVQFTSATTYNIDRVSPAVNIVTAQPYASGQPISFVDPLHPANTFSFTAYGTPQPGDLLTIGSSATARPMAQTKANIFEVLDTVITGINGAAGTQPGLTQTLQDGLSRIDGGLNRISSARSQAGAWLNRADAISGAQEARSVQLEGERSRAEDMDMIQGISSFQSLQTGYEAALKTYAQVQRLSLFNYIS